MRNLLTKIDEKKAVMGIIGLGYVGLPTAMTFAQKFKVIGYDVNRDLIESLKGGNSHIEDVPDSVLTSCLDSSFFPSFKEDALQDCDFILISVPTPLKESKEPDLRYIIDAGNIVAKFLRKGQFVILESTTYPSTTETVLVPILEKSGLRAGKDFGVAYSPERIDPGNKGFTIQNTPRVVGGINGECTIIACKLFESVVPKAISVSDCRTAEATKMLENIFRNVNIAMINEMAMIFEKMDINVWEVVKAASTKPFGFMSFFPGPGVGGHCIPLDPFYMSYRARQLGLAARFIELSGEVNEFMRFHVVNLLQEGLSKAEKDLSGSTVAVLGLTYKGNVRDTRESPAKKIIEEILARGGTVKVYDPLAEEIVTGEGIFSSEKCIEDALRGADATLFLTDHTHFSEIDERIFSELMNARPVIIDAKNIFERAPSGTTYFGLGKPREEATPSAAQ